MSKEESGMAVVIPVYNEEGSIRKIVREWAKVLEPIPGSRLLVINDGSTDGTMKALDAIAGEMNVPLSVITQANAGHGQAILRGYKEAIQQGVEWIFQADGDDQVDPNDFPKIWERRNHSSFILGYRVKRSDPFYRKIITRGVRILILFLFGRYIPDANVPFRLMRADFLRELLDKVDQNDFAPNISLSIAAAVKGAPLLNVPIAHYSRDRGTPSLPLRRWSRLAFRCTGDILNLRWRLFFGK